MPAPLQAEMDRRGASTPLRTSERNPASKKARKIWIVLPAYNEEENIEKLIENISAAQLDSSYRCEVVVVDDGSQDLTKSKAQALAEQHSVTVLVHEKNQGLGATLRDGFRYVSERAQGSDIIVSMDADNTHNPETIHPMVTAILEGNDVVIASRYQPGASVRGVSGFRQTLSLGAGLLFRVCFPVRGVKDYTCGYRAYRAEIIQKAFRIYGKDFINQNGFECMVDILIQLRKLNAICREVPLVLRYDLKKGASKMRVSQTILRSLLLIAKHRFMPATSTYSTGN